MQGKLKDMSVADLIQHNCLDGKTARLIINNGRHEAAIYVENGEVVHGTMEGAQGEEVVYRILNWNDGTFQLDADEAAPAKTITKNWTGLLLEGARLLDESGADGVCDVCGSPTVDGGCMNTDCENFVGNDPNEVENKKSFYSNSTKENVKMAKTRGERLADALNELLADSSDINGAAIVGHDGLVYSANVPQKTLDEEMVGAVSASIYGLGQRSAAQLQRGELVRTMVQGTDGNIIVASINDETVLVALTGKAVNLGMAFMEVRSMSQTLAELL